MNFVNFDKALISIEDLKLLASETKIKKSFSDLM